MAGEIRRGIVRNIDAEFMGGELLILEVLTVRLDPARREEYLALDREVWTETQRKHPGFLRKEAWLGEDPDEVTFGVWWESREALAAFPATLTAELDRRMEEIPATIVGVRVLDIAPVSCCEP